MSIIIASSAGRAKYCGTQGIPCITFRASDQFDARRVTGVASTLSPHQLDGIYDSALAYINAFKINTVSLTEVKKKTFFSCLSKRLTFVV